MTLTITERELNDDLKKIIQTPDDNHLEKQLEEYKNKTEEKLIAVKKYHEIEDQLLSLDTVSEIENSLMLIKKNVKKKRKIVDDIIGDIIGDGDIKPKEMREQIGLSVDE